MCRLLVGAGVMALATIIAVSTQAPKAHACSVGPDFDPVASSDVIVEGRFLGFEVLPETAPAGFVPVRVQVSVTRVLKGQVSAPTIDLVDPATYTVADGQGHWGGGGSCGAFGSDPTGRYAIIGLHQNDDGTYRPTLPLWFFAGEGPGGAEYERALERMASFPGAAELPALGSGPDAGGGVPAMPIAIAAAGAALLLSGSAMAVALRRRAA